MSWLDQISASGGAALLAGAAGGIVRTLTLRQCGWRDALVNIGVGSLCALYLGPVVEPMLQPALGSLMLEPQSVATFSGFIIGLSGITISGFVLDIIASRRRKLGGGDDA